MLASVSLSLADVAAGYHVELALFLSLMFFVCMICHGELSQRRPPSEQLTDFYLTMSAGGALGGIAVAIVCPTIFHSYMELKLLAWAGIAVAVFSILKPHANNQLSGFRKIITFATAGVGLFLVTGAAWSPETEGTMLSRRNFYGVLRIELMDDYPRHAGLALYHGKTIHGFQHIGDKRRNKPTTYYSKRSGVGVAMRTIAERGPAHVGVVGLGVGTMASYGRKGDRFQFYEINPDVIQIAQAQFTFLQDTPAEVETVLGDARVSLDQQPDQEFNLLVLDAFSGDGIPTHLLTKEAFQIYDRHLAPGGLLAVHVSNRYLNLFRVVRGAAEEMDFKIAYVEDLRERTDADAASDWLILARNNNDLESALINKRRQPSADLLMPPIVWTDEYSDLLSVMK
ncbi:MAG TPA: hypothetical protein EYG03_05080 [Planctomycetes bacterium]|nr:hypothetical protein [Planctomycetota bacterium]